MGHRVRAHFDGFTLEANSVVISPGGLVMAQTSSEMARRRGAGTDKTFFNTKTRQIHRLIHTSGEVRSFYFFIEDGLLSERANDQFEVSWSVDTRPWNPILAFDNKNRITLGSTKDLAYSMEFANSRVKLEIEDIGGDFKGLTSEMYLEINNMRTSDISALKPEIIGQSLRTVPVDLNKGGKSYTLDLYFPVKQYIEISTSTGVSSHLYSMKSRGYLGRADWTVRSITWFQDSRLYN
ncbi:hypothetical protein PoB_004340000 [Plakobranchus ocellatus]|uniref:Uncharacterized protein n=1 Tax=Plakobranchus ocellatus TaxID=259542 RepID=A0AAV4BBI4_9GAST|nr:hypothetical protein PoB_004340000 [Plakobranchus ocellatus]